MRDRLIKLLQNFADGTYTSNGTITDGTKVDDVVDYLIANGVIVPPCKVGDTVYYVHKSEHKITTHKVTNIYVGKSMTISAKGLWSTIKPHEFGWLFYTSKEEAETALKERDVR